MSIHRLEKIAEEVESWIREWEREGDFKSSLSSNSSDERFNTIFFQLLEAQLQAIPIYKKWWTLQGISLDKVKSWKQVPPISVRVFTSGMCTPFGDSQRNFWFESSGTTSETRSKHFHNWRSLLLYENALWPGFVKSMLPAQLDKPQYIISLLPPKSEARYSSLVYMVETIAIKSRIPLYCFGEVNEQGYWSVKADLALKFLLEVERNKQVVLMIGTSFLWKEFFDYMKKMDIKIQLFAGSRAMETGGYKGRYQQLSKVEFYEMFQKTLGLASEYIVSEYGMCELSSQAYDHVVGVLLKQTDLQQRAFMFPPWVRIRVLSPETMQELPPGQLGLLAIYDLANVFSIAALLTEDLAISNEDGTFVLIGRAPGATIKGCSIFAEV